jgi:hypothetical protein
LEWTRRKMKSLFLIVFSVFAIFIFFTLVQSCPRPNTSDDRVEWTCHPELGPETETVVPENTFCISKCDLHSVGHTCVGNEWDVPGSFCFKLFDDLHIFGHSSEFYRNGVIHLNLFLPCLSLIKLEKYHFRKWPQLLNVRFVPFLSFWWLANFLTLIRIVKEWDGSSKLLHKTQNMDFL